MTDDREEQLQVRQDGRVYPLGQALRATYRADNHDSLDNDVTGLMLDLSKVPYEDEEMRFALPSPPVMAAPPPRSWVTRLGHLFGQRRA